MFPPNILKVPSLGFHHQLKPFSLVYVTRIPQLHHLNYFRVVISPESRLTVNEVQTPTITSHPDPHCLPFLYSPEITWKLGGGCPTSHCPQTLSLPSTAKLCLFTTSQSHQGYWARTRANNPAPESQYPLNLPGILLVAVVQLPGLQHHASLLSSQARQELACS